jgi:hypothetical protein
VVGPVDGCQSFSGVDVSCLTRVLGRRGTIWTVENQWRKSTDWPANRCGGTHRWMQSFNGVANGSSGESFFYLNLLHLKM